MSPGRWTAVLPADRTVRRILVLKWSAMGDVVMATAAMQDIVDAFPGAEVDLDVQPPWDRLFAGDRRFARLLGCPVRGPAGRARGTWRWLRAVAAARYDAVFDLQSNDHTRALLGALVLARAAPRYRVGYHRRLPYNVAPPTPSHPLHAARYARGALRAAGIEPRADRPVLAVPEAARERARALLERNRLAPGAYAVFLPGCQAAGYLKRWGTERYAALARRLAARGLGPALLLGGPDEREECAAIARAAGAAAIDLCGRTEIPDLVPLCAGARFVVANDTGTAHVAAAAGRPLVVVCGPTDPRRVRPIGPAVRTVQADLPCVNCYRKHCPHHACMRLLGPERVEAALDLT